MDIYAETANLLLQLSTTKNWPEIQEMIEFALSKKPHDWQLPVIACEAVGGRARLALPAIAAIACLQMSIILVDDMLDQDPRGLYHRTGAGIAANRAAALQAIGLEAVASSTASQSKIFNAISNLNRMVITTALGQEMDVKKIENENDYWKLVHTKSSPFFGSSLYAGAILGGASAEVAAMIERIGWIYGEMIQIHDDLNDTMETPANPDWLQGRSTLPILFAQIVDHPDREKFLKLRQNPEDPDKLREAQTILIRCGAISYGIHQLLSRRGQAMKLIESDLIKNKNGLEGLIDGVVQPVMKMFAAIGIKDPEIMLQDPKPAS